MGSKGKADEERWKVKTVYAICFMMAMLSLSIRAADMSGDWTVKLAHDGNEEGPTLIVTFKQDGEKLTGRCRVEETDDEFTASGELSGDMVAWQCRSPRFGDSTFTGTLRATGLEMTGSWRTTKPAQGTFVAKKL